MSLEKCVPVGEICIVWQSVFGVLCGSNERRKWNEALWPCFAASLASGDFFSIDLHRPACAETLENVKKTHPFHCREQVLNFAYNYRVIWHHCWDSRNTHVGQFMNTLQQGPFFLTTKADWFSWFFIVATVISKVAISAAFHNDNLTLVSWWRACHCMPFFPNFAKTDTFMKCRQESTQTNRMSQDSGPSMISEAKSWKMHSDRGYARFFISVVFALHSSACFSFFACLFFSSESIIHRPFFQQRCFFTAMLSIVILEMCVFLQPEHSFSRRRTKPNHFESHMWKVCSISEPGACFMCRAIVTSLSQYLDLKSHNLEMCVFPQRGRNNFQVMFRTFFIVCAGLHRRAWRRASFPSQGPCFSIASLFPLAAQSLACMETSENVTKVTTLHVHWWVSNCIAVFRINLHIFLIIAVSREIRTKCERQHGAWNPSKSTVFF